jgi:streptogramin lyase
MLAFLTMLIVAAAASAQVASVTTWELPAPGSLPGQLGLAGERVYVSLFGPQTIGRLDPSANTLVEWSVDGPPVGLTVHDRGVFYTLPMDGVLGILQPSVNVVTGWAVPSGGWPQSLAPAASGPGVVNLWFNERTGGRVARYAPNAIQLPLYLGLDPVPQAVMPRTQSIDPQSQVVTPQVFPGNPMLVPPIALAPKTSLGGFTEWTPVWSSGYVEDVAVAPDGRIWFAQADARLTVLDPPSDGMMPYGLPDGTQAFAVTASTTGDIWFADGSRPAIGRLEPDTSDVTLWEIPFGNQPLDLAIDELGDLWITDRQASTIYNFRPATSEFVWWTLGSGRGPLYLEMGELGTVWFTEEGGNAVSRLSILPVLGPPPMPEPPPDTSGLTILGWRYVKSGSVATATINYLYQGGLGTPIFFGLQVLSGDTVLPNFVTEPARVDATGSGTVQVGIRYTGGSVIDTDGFRLYVAQSQMGAPIFWRDFEALITWYP